MKHLLSLLLIYVLITVNAYSAGKIQGADVKSEAELIAAGATKAQMITDSKIYVQGSGVNDTLYNAIQNGAIGGGIPAWATATTYTVGKQVYESDKFYRCIANHLSSAAFATDLPNWVEQSGPPTNITGNAATVTTNANLTGPITSVGNATSITNASVGLTTKVTGTLPIANGGTNNSTALTSGSVPYFDGTKIAENNSSLFWDNTNGRLAVGNNVPVSKIHATASSTTGAIIAAENNENTTASAPATSVLKRSRGTFAAPTAVQSGDMLGIYAITGFGSTVYPSAAPAGYAAFATETFTDAAKGSKLRFRITPNGTLTHRFAMDLDQDGGLVLNGSTSGSIKFLPAATTTSYNLTLPAAQGGASTSLVNDGSGNLSWGSAGGITPITATVPLTNVNWATIQNTVGLYTKTLSANVTLVFSGAIAGQSINFRITQGASAYTVTWPTIKWAGGTAPVITTTSGKADIVSIFFDGIDYYGTFIQNF